MLEYALLFICNSLYIMGIYISCNYERDAKGNVDEDTKMIFWWFKYYGTKWLGKQIMKPICRCPVCMASVHGFLFYSAHLWLTGASDSRLIIVLPFYIFILAGLNQIVYAKFID